MFSRLLHVYIAVFFQCLSRYWWSSLGIGLFLLVLSLFLYCQAYYMHISLFISVPWSPLVEFYWVSDCFCWFLASPLLSSLLHAYIAVYFSALVAIGGVLLGIGLFLLVLSLFLCCHTYYMYISLLVSVP